MSLHVPFAFPGEEAAPTVAFPWVRRALGQSGPRAPSDARFAAFIETLIAELGFPRPLPHPRHGGGIETGVTEKSCWLRAGVVDWLGDYLPPDAAAAVDTAHASAAADEMDEAAALLGKPRLQLVGGA